MPCYKFMEVPAIQSLIALQAGIYNKGDNVSIVFIDGFNAARARTHLLKYAATQDQVDYVLNIDSDHTYTAESFYDLVEKLETNNLEMLSAGYLVRNGERKFCHGSLGEDKKFNKANPDTSSGITDCDVVGFGFLLMTQDFVKKMVETYGNDMFLLDTVESLTEDVYFCKQAKKIGTRVCFDSDNMVGHLMTIIRK